MSSKSRRNTVTKEKQSNMYTKLKEFLMEKNLEAFYRKNTSLTSCLKFKNMQIIRLFLVALTLFVWGAFFFINVKKCVMYLNFWSLTFTLLYLLYVIPNAGKILVDDQLLEIKEIKEEELSQGWKKAILFYSMAWPITVTSCVTFSTFFLRDQICATYLDFGFSRWREVVVIMATYTPLLVLSIELIINRVPLSYKHTLMNLIIICLYISLNVLS